MDIIATMRLDIEKSVLENQIDNIKSCNISYIRVNFAKLDSDNKIKQVVNRIIEIKKYIPNLKIMIDLPYPKRKIRLDLLDKTTCVKENEEYMFVKRGEEFNFFKNHIYVDGWCENKNKRKGDILYYADGEASFEIVKADKNYIIAKALSSCTLYNRKSISIGNLNIDRSYLINLKKYLEPIHIDSIALSFVEKEEDIDIPRAIFEDHQIQFIGKIESTNALKKIDSIIKTCDAIMIARGDLSLYAGIDKILENQNFLIKKAKEVKKDVYIATGILSSLKYDNIPNPADIIDLTFMIKADIYGIILNNFLVYYNKISTAANMIKDVYRGER